MRTRFFALLTGLVVLPSALLSLFTACGDDNPVDSQVTPVDSSIVVLFLSDRDGTDRVYGMNARASYLIPMVSDTVTYKEVAWSPDGSRFACIGQNINNPDWQIQIVHVDSMTVVSTPLGADEVRHLAWSPDGTRIAVAFDPIGGGVHFNIVTVNADGSQGMWITDLPGDQLWPAWHPYGTLITCGSYNTGTSSWETRWILADGSSTSIKIYTTTAGGPSGWSPDRSRYFRCDTDASQDHAIVEENGTFVSSLASAHRIDCPTWLPDGTALLMSLPPMFPGNYEVTLWHVTGGGLEVLSGTSGNNTQPDCNDAMTRIVFRSDRDGNEEIYRMNFDGSQQVNLTKNAARDWGPKWRPGR